MDKNLLNKITYEMQHSDMAGKISSILYYSDFVQIPTQTYRRYQGVNVLCCKSEL